MKKNKLRHWEKRGKIPSRQVMLDDNQMTRQKSIYIEKKYIYEATWAPKHNGKTFIDFVSSLLLYTLWELPNPSAQPGALKVSQKADSAMNPHSSK